MSPRASSTAKRDVLKVAWKKNGQYSGTYEVLIMSTVERKFTQECDAFEVPELQTLSAMKRVLRDKALFYSTENF